MGKKINEIGHRFGRLLILKEVKIRNKVGVFWECLCDCGIITRVAGTALRSGHTKSCGCLNRERVSKVAKIEEIGNRYGRLTVLKDVGRTDFRCVLWLCKCDCGNTLEVSGISLRSGHTQSCGCYNRDRVRETQTIHGKCSNGNTVGYPSKWTHEFRESIRNRDNRICRVCGTTEEEENRSLSVHHIDYNRENTTEGNCISLCNSCHAKTNHSREEWAGFFKLLMENN